MNTSFTINAGLGYMNFDLSLLKDKEVKELMSFYNYLLFKSGQNIEQIQKKQIKKLPETFYKPIKVEAFTKFDRDEIYADR